MLDYLGTVFAGSSDLEISVGEAEILPSGESYINFQLYNDGDCHISINGGDYIFIRAKQGIDISRAMSIKIYEDSITYNWIGVKS